MTGYRIDDVDRLMGLSGKSADATMHIAEAGPCMAIMTIAKDFQDLVRAECKRCGSGSGACLVEQLQAAARDAAPD